MMNHPSLSSKERSALLSSPGPARFKHLITQAADCETLWGLRNDVGWVVLADKSGAPGFPIWSHPDYASECATDDWAGCVQTEINVHEFVENWLPDMRARGVSVAVFPTPSMKGVWISPDVLKLNLEEELAKYE
jgi:hypothetical protein